MDCLRFILLAFSIIALVACGEEPQQQKAATATPQAVKTGETPPVRTNPLIPAVNRSADGVTVQITPENPTVTGCLQAVVQGVHHRNGFTWKINGEIIPKVTGSQLCNGSYTRNDTVTVEVSATDERALASVSIVNSLPQVIDLSFTPSKVFAGTDLAVTAVAEDADGDNVDFTYTWLINGEADPLLTESTLPGSRFTKGDSVQLLVVPNDFYDDGPTYESPVRKIPNAAPQITSQPPQGISTLDYRYQVAASDPDDSTFTYRLDDAPAGMSIGKISGLIQWSLVDVAPGDYAVAIVVTDPEGSEAPQNYILTLGAPQ